MKVRGFFHLTISFCRSLIEGYGCGKLDRTRSVGGTVWSAPKLMKLYWGGSLGLSRVISIFSVDSLIGPGSRSLNMLPAQQPTHVSQS